MTDKLISCLESPAVLINNPANPKNLHDQVLQRYNTVRWADNSSRKSLIHTIARSEDVKTRLGRAVVNLKVTMSSSLPGTTPAIIRKYLPKYVRDPTAWVEAHTYQEPRGHLALLHVSFDLNGAPCSFHEDITG